MGVIWAIGASMVVLAGAQFLGRRACLRIGAAILVGHNLLDPVWPLTNPLQVGGPWWAPLHSQASYVLVPFYMVFQYPLLPWIGVMLLGYGTAAVFEEAQKRRNALLLTLGMAATTAFVAIRAVGFYGDPNPWQIDGGVTRTLIDFLNTTKYPPSLLFLLMTLGPASVLCSFADRVPEAIKQPFIIFGRVPFAFYVAHLYLIHTLSVGLGVIQGFEAHQFVTGMRFFPKGYGIGLPGVYVVWLLVIVLLYPFCKCVSEFKWRRHEWWLSYV